MMRLPMPAEPDEPPAEPLVTLRLRMRDGRLVDHHGVPASYAAALAIWGPGDDVAGAWVIYPPGVSDLFGQSA